MAEEYVVEWPLVPGAPYYHVPGQGGWRPLPVLLEPLAEPWAHRLYADSELARAVHEERRPRQGVLVIDPDPCAHWDRRELALVVRVPPDPPGEEHRLRFPCLFINDSHPEPGTPWQDHLVESRRWIAIRRRPIKGRAILRATATRAEAIRHALQSMRMWEGPPLPEPEAEPEGDDLVELEILAGAAARGAG